MLFSSTSEISGGAAAVVMAAGRHRGGLAGCLCVHVSMMLHIRADERGVTVSIHGVLFFPSNTNRFANPLSPMGSRKVPHVRLEARPPLRDCQVPEPVATGSALRAPLNTPTRNIQHVGPAHAGHMDEEE